MFWPEPGPRKRNHRVNVFGLRATMRANAIAGIGGRSQPCSIFITVHLTAAGERRKARETTELAWSSHRCLLFLAWALSLSLSFSSPSFTGPHHGVKCLRLVLFTTFRCEKGIKGDVVFREGVHHQSSQYNIDR